MPAKLNIEKGQKFAFLTIVREVERQNSFRKFLVQCDCGTRREVFLNSLTSGNTKSCGCMKAELNRQQSTRHGLRKHSLYAVHHAMMARCYDPEHAAFADYGARGIKVYKPWHDLATFIAWAEPHYKPGLFFDREDNDRGYRPTNCRFITHAKSNNNRRDTVWVKLRGQRVTFSEAWHRYGKAPYATCLKRYRSHGWSLKDALQTPARAKRN